MTRSGAGRLVGLDVARCLALLGMVATHVLDDRDVNGDLGAGQWLAGGRASALFAVLAGVSLALMTGRRVPLARRERVSRTAGLAVRAVLIALLGLVLGAAESGLAIILTYYGVLFALGLPFLGLRTRPLLALAAIWVLAAPVLAQVVRPLLPDRQFASPALDQLADPAQLASELLFTGYYPCVPWLAYLVFGMALGRADLRRGVVQASLVAGGLVLAVVATVVSHLLTSRESVVDRLLAADPNGESGPHLLDSISTGMFGQTPVDGSWAWLLVVAPHSSTPFDLAQTLGSAAAVIGLCLGVVSLLGAGAERAVAVFFGAGTMTLTLYSLHVLMRTPAVWPAEEPDTFRWHVLVLLGIGAAFAAASRRGPIEQLIRLCSGAVSRQAR